MEKKEVMDDKDIIYILKNRKQLLNIIQKKMEHAYGFIESLDEIIQRLSLQGMNEESLGGASAEKILLRRDLEHKKQIQEQEKILQCLLKEEEKIYDIFQGMAQLPAEDYELLDSLYVKEMTWEVYAKKNDISVSTLGRKKRKALDGLKKVYEKI